MRQANEFPATAFGPGFEGGRAGGRLHLTEVALRFVSSAGTVEFPWPGLQLRAGGHDGRQLFIEHAARPGLTVTTAAAPLLGDPRVGGRVELRSQVAAARRAAHSWGIGWIILLILALACVAALVWVIAQKDRWVRLVAERVPITFEIELGRRALEPQKAKLDNSTHPAHAARLKAVAARLLPAVATSGYAFEFHVLQDTNVNAFALPGGQVVVHTGLLDAIKNSDELAGVLAHELAHVTHRHGLRRLIESAGLALLVQSLFGNTSGLEGFLIEGSRLLLEQKYSRDFEREADAAGWAYLIDSNIDPRGMIEFFKTLKKVEEAHGSGAAGLSFLGTHPATDERMRALADRWEGLERKTGFHRWSDSAVPHLEPPVDSAK